MDPTSLDGLRAFVNATKLHPILVNFTAALVPVSLASDLAASVSKKEPLRQTAWWCLLYATALTPFTAAAGWLFWMKDDNGSQGMAIHKWLGTAFVALLFLLFLWRRDFQRRGRPVTAAYLFVGALLLAALVYQGHLGGAQTYSGM